MAIHHSLRRLRLNCGMTQEQVAERIGITRQALSSYESGRTRPDIDMLLKLSHIYGTDLEGVLYGQERQLKTMGQIHRTAKILFVLLWGLTAISSALLWSANRFFAVSEGQLSAEEMAVFVSRQKLIHGWEFTDRITLTCGSLGFLLLLVFLISGRCVITLKTKMKYGAALAAVLFGTALLFAMADPVFPIVNHIITPALVVGRFVIFLMADLIIEYFQRRK